VRSVRHRRVLWLIACPHGRRREEYQLPFLLGPLFVLLTELHHPCPGEGEVVLTGAAHDDVVEDADTDVFHGLGDLVRGVDVLFAGIALLSRVTCWLPSRWSTRQRLAHMASIA